jgi:hypothetical protein
VLIIVLGVLFLLLAIGRLTVREIDKPGLCGSIVQGPSWDDGGASTHVCNQLRHDDGLEMAGFFILALASFGFGVGHLVYRTGRGSA